MHALQAGCPLLGDEKYGSAASEALGSRLGLGRLFLHAWRLGFALPGTGRLELEAPLDNDLESVLEKLRS